MPAGGLVLGHEHVQGVTTGQKKWRPCRLKHCCHFPNPTIAEFAAVVMTQIDYFCVCIAVSFMNPAQPPGRDGASATDRLPDMPHPAAA